MGKVYRDGATMGLKDIPKRGDTGVYDEEGTTRIPDDVRNAEDLQLKKGEDLTWVKMPNEEFIRVYRSEDSDEIPE